MTRTKRKVKRHDTRPFYARMLRLKHIRPGHLVCFVLFEGSIALAFLLGFAELISVWTAVALPVLVAMMVKLNDVIAGATADPPDDPDDPGDSGEPDEDPLVRHWAAKQQDREPYDQCEPAGDEPYDEAGESYADAPDRRSAATGAGGGRSEEQVATPVERDEAAGDLSPAGAGEVDEPRPEESEVETAEAGATDAGTASAAWAASDGGAASVTEEPQVAAKSHDEPPTGDDSGGDTDDDKPARDAGVATGNEAAGTDDAAPPRKRDGAGTSSSE